MSFVLCTYMYNSNNVEGLWNWYVIIEAVTHVCITVMWFKIIVNTKLIFSPSSFDTTHFFLFLSLSLSRIIFGIYTSPSTYLNFSLIQKLCLIYVYQQYFSLSPLFFFYIRIFGKKKFLLKENIKDAFLFAILHKWILPVIQ